MVDTTSDVEDAKEVKAEFAKLSTAPVRAIIYTHSHPDHTGGGGVFAGNDHPEILAHRLFVERVPDVGRNGRDGGDQFGSTLPEALFINAGTGLEFGRHPAPTAYVAPTRTFSGDRLELTIAGLRLQLLHTPGETRENVAVWLPDRRVPLPVSAARPTRPLRHTTTSHRDPMQQRRQATKCEHGRAQPATAGTARSQGKAHLLEEGGIARITLEPLEVRVALYL